LCFAPPVAHPSARACGEILGSSYWGARFCINAHSPPLFPPDTTAPANSRRSISTIHLPGSAQPKPEPRQQPPNLPPNLTVASVTRENFEEVFETQVKPALQAADFICLDLEMSGLDSGSFRRPLDADTVATRFLHGRHSAMQYAVMQLGVCSFRWDEERKEFIVHPFNFKVFPRSEIPGFKGVPVHSFQCQPSSLEFLAAHHLDFNSWVQHGISYLSHEQEEAAWKFLDLPPPSATATNKGSAPSQQGSADVAQPTNHTQASTSSSSSSSRYSWRDSGDRTDPSSAPFPRVQFAMKSLSRVDMWLARLRAAAQVQSQARELAGGGVGDGEGDGAGDGAGHGVGVGAGVSAGVGAGVDVGGDGSSSSGGLPCALAAVVGGRPWLSLRINDAFNCHAADQAIRYKHPYLASHEERVGAYKRVRLFLCQSKDEAEDLQNRLLGLRQSEAAAVVRKAVGVRRVVDALALACQEKPLVAHSFFLDLSHILHKFVGRLPPSPAAFSHEVRRLFPALWDTSWLSAAALLHQEVASTNRRATLSDLYDVSRNLPFVGGAPMRVQFGHEAARYSTSNGQDLSHEAAYDAFMTGVVFAQTCHRLGLPPHLLSSLPPAAAAVAAAAREEAGRWGEETKGEGRGVVVERWRRGEGVVSRRGEVDVGRWSKVSQRSKGSTSISAADAPMAAAPSAAAAASGLATAAASAAAAAAAAATVARLSNITTLIGKGARDIHLDLATGRAAVGCRAPSFDTLLSIHPSSSSFSSSPLSPNSSSHISAPTTPSSSIDLTSSSSSSSSRREEDRSNVLFVWGVPPSLPPQRLRFLLRGLLGYNAPLEVELIDSGAPDGSTATDGCGAAFGRSAALVRFGSGKERDVENVGRVMGGLGRALAGSGRGGGGGAGVGERLGERAAAAAEMVSLGIRAAPFSAFVTLCECTVPFTSASEGADVFRFDQLLLAAGQRSPARTQAVKTSRPNIREGRGAREGMVVVDGGSKTGTVVQPRERVPK
ncbi:hypothetical protein CLOP_g11970, partial [Closterium sp. NIES-67]